MKTFNDLRPGDTVQYLKNRSKFFTKNCFYKVLSCKLNKNGKFIILLEDDISKDRHGISENYFNANFNIVIEVPGKLHVITPEQAEVIIDRVCFEWKERLAKIWGTNIVLNKTIEVTDKLVKEGMSLASPKQQVFLSRIFKTEIDWDSNPLVIGKDSGKVIRVISHKDNTFSGVCIDSGTGLSEYFGKLNHSWYKKSFNLIDDTYN